MKKTSIWLLGAMSGAGVLGTLGTVSAATLDTGIDGLKATWVSNLTTGIGIRTKAPSCALTGSAAGCGASANTELWANGDDGNLNYRKNQAYTGYLSGTSELLLTMPDSGYKFLVRGTAMYDFLADRTERTELTDAVRNQAVRSGQLLDLWLQKDFDLGEQRAHARFGNQVINWGESYFATGGINNTNSVDNQKLLIPGTQLKQALLPAPMLSVASSLPGGFSTEAYYQFGWNGNRYPPVGTFWSASDVFGRGTVPASFNSGNYNVAGPDAGQIAGAGSKNPGTMANVNAGLLNGDYAGAPWNSIGFIYDTVRPGNQPQYGLRVGYKPQDLDMTFGFYYENYTDKAPVLSYLANGISRWSYLKDRSLYGISTNFQIGDWALGSELSYRPHDAVSMSGCFAAGGPADLNTNFVSGVDCQAWRDTKKYQFDINAQLNMTRTSAPVVDMLGADLGVFTAELTWIRYPGINKDTRYAKTINGRSVYQLVAAAYGTWLDRTSPLGYPIATGKGTANSGGLTVDFNVTYDGTVIPGWQVTPGITFYDAVKGNTPTFSANYQQGARSAYAYLLFNKNPQVWQMGLSYVAYFGGNALTQPYSDRNALGAFLTRNF
jgi:hypothetical protein